MPGQWDDVMKLLIGIKPQHFVAWLLLGARFVRELPKELKSRTIQADILYEIILNGKRMILHIEFQRRRDRTMGKRLWEYNVLAMYTSGLPVCSVAFYFKKEGNVIGPPYRIELPNGEVVHVFFFKNIKLWEIPTEVVKQFGLGLYPLLPLTKDGARKEVVDEVVTTLAVAGENDLLALAKVLGGLTFKTEAQRQWFDRRFIMHNSIIEESWVYQEWKQKGKLEAQRQTLVSYVEMRFPQIVALAKQQADAIKDPEVLQDLILKMFSAQTAEEAEQCLITVSKEEKVTPTTTATARRKRAKKN